MNDECERNQTLTLISDLVADLQGAYDDRDRAMADHLGVGRTDLRCLDLLVRQGPASAAQLGPLLHLTRGSMSTLVSRLEIAGYVRRHDDPDHGSRKIIAVTEHLINQITPLVAHLADHGAQHLKSFNNDDLHTIRAYLSGEVARQTRTTTTIRSTAESDQVHTRTRLTRHLAKTTTPGSM